MTFSIIIPVYNAAATISRTLQSCLAQSVPAQEIIVVDDGSTDESALILQSFGSKIRLLTHESNKGVAAARNTGWDAATGDYILFLDSDDVFHPRKIELVAQILKIKPAIRFLFHQYTVDAFREITPEELVTRQVSFLSVLLRNPAATPCIVLKRDLPLRFNGKFRYCEDHELVARAAWTTEAWSIGATLAALDHPILSGHGLSSKKWRMRLGEMKMYLGIWRYNKGLLPLIPLLLLWSLGKHFLKMAKYR